MELSFAQVAELVDVDVYKRQPFTHNTSSTADNAAQAIIGKK